MAPQIDWRFVVALVLAHETGHWISAICHLRWSDVDMARRRIRWRAEHDKGGRAHWTPLSDAALGALVEARHHHPGVGDTWVLPAPRQPHRAGPRDTMARWFVRAAKEADVALPPRTGFHALRRKFASELLDAPLKVLMDLGGWRDHKTLLGCYQEPDDRAMRETLRQRRGAANRHCIDTTGVSSGHRPR